MKFRAFWRSFAVAMLVFGSLALLITGIFIAYVGTRKIGFASNVSLIELCDLHTIRFMDWYFETDALAWLVRFIAEHLPAR